jgi:exopolyphosphatase/guanosine-5'-triphosphate,3'-diphosphate pyrophosphatase
MILAGIDIGTNTLRLLIAELGPALYREIGSDRRITRLGQDLDRAGVLSREARERSIQALADFSTRIEKQAVRQVDAVATSALRKASNSREFITEVKQRTGLDIRVIPGEDEARFTLLGVSKALQSTSAGEKNPLSSALVVDIGGGSTEIIITRPGVEPVAMSLPLGAVYLTERFIRHDPPSGEELERLRRSVREELDHQSALLRPGPACVFVGTAGTITTLAAMDQKLTVYDPERINRSKLTRTAIDGMVRKLSESMLKERRNFRGLEHGREDIILAGAIVTQEIMERFGFSTILVSDWGLREGIVFDLYEKLSIGHSAKCKGNSPCALPYALCKARGKVDV